MNNTYRLAQFLSYCYLKCFHRFEVNGVGNVPPKGGFILAGNQLSSLDPPAIGCRIPRNLHYFARDSLFFGPLGILITKLNSIPVNRDQLDLGTLRKVLGVLKERACFSISGRYAFPERNLTKTSKGTWLVSSQKRCAGAASKITRII